MDDKRVVPKGKGEQVKAMNETNTLSFLCEDGMTFDC